MDSGFESEGEGEINYNLAQITTILIRCYYKSSEGLAKISKKCKQLNKFKIKIN